MFKLTFRISGTNPRNLLIGLMLTTMAASTAMFLPVSSPLNAIAYGTGLIEQKDFMIGGVMIGVLGPLLAILWVLLIT